MSDTVNNALNQSRLLRMEHVILELRRKAESLKEDINLVQNQAIEAHNKIELHKEDN